ncbi:hypothetical protein HY383_00575 [Candidatus Daviesbacteria bacterium]|nr:hypothetical protein [Candidatus Daviesbacteria bacterium]
MAEAGGEKLVGGNTSLRRNKLPRRRFLETVLVLGAQLAIGKAGGIIKLVEIGTGATQASLKTLEQNPASATATQRQAIEEFNKLEDEIRRNPKSLELQRKRVYQLKTGSQGAWLVPEPFTADKQITMANGNKLLADTDYNIPGGAIKVLGKNPFNSTGLPQIEWYFITTQRDRQTHKVAGGYFAYAGSFVPTARGTVAQHK